MFSLGQQLIAGLMADPAVDNHETVLLASIGAFAAISSWSGKLESEAVALLLVSFLALLVEYAAWPGSIQPYFQSQRSSPGIPLGVITLPLLFLARSLQDLRMEPSQDSLMKLSHWTALACGAGMAASVAAAWLHTSQSGPDCGQNGPSSHPDASEPRGQTSREHSNEAAAANPRLRRVPEASAAQNGGGDHLVEQRPAPPDAGSRGQHPEPAEKGAKSNGVCHAVGKAGDRPPAGIPLEAAAALGWAGGSLAVAGFAVSASNWTGAPALVATWLIAHSACCGLLHFGLQRSFPGSATAGEALLAAEGLTLYFGDAVARTLAKVAPWLPLPQHYQRGLEGTISEIDAVVQAMVVGLLLVPALWWLLSPLAVRAARLARRPPGGAAEAAEAAKAGHVAAFYGAFLLVVLVLVPGWLKHVVGLGKHPLVWAVEHILEHAQTRVALCGYWLLVMLVPLRALRRMASERRVAHILVRKYYHLMATAMFVPALILQAGFLRLAFGVALAAFLVLELLRVGRVPPFGRPIDAFMQAFVDSRDSGALIASHFSLLLGCAVPVWLSRQGASDRPLAPFAGILSLGIGDTMASVVGYQFGRVRVSRHSRKTAEGTLAGILSMFLAACALAPHVAAPPQSLAEWAAVFAATSAAGLLEAYTRQLDNAFVPLVYFALLSL